MRDILIWNEFCASSVSPLLGKISIGYFRVSHGVSTRDLCTSQFHSQTSGKQKVDQKGGIITPFTTLEHDKWHTPCNKLCKPSPNLIYTAIQKDEISIGEILYPFSGRQFSSLRRSWIEIMVTCPEYPSCYPISPSWTTPKNFNGQGQRGVRAEEINAEEDFLVRANSVSIRIDFIFNSTWVGLSCPSNHRHSRIEFNSLGNHIIFPSIIWHPHLIKIIATLIVYC